MSDKQTIYIAAYPKSGSTYLTRLLGDVLNSPTGGCMPEQDSKEVATEGQDRPGSYIVRKGHFVLIDDDTGPAVPRPHRLAWRQLTDEKIVFLVRDPRDICISGAYHWRTSSAEFLDRMIKGDVAGCGRWDKYCDSWIRSHQKAVDYYGLLIKSLDDIVIIKYENLLIWPMTFIAGILNDINIQQIDLQLIDEAVQRQSFATRKAQIGDNEQELRRNNMRKGIAGDWRNHFTKEMNDKIWFEFGWMMERLGYNK